MDVTSPVARNFSAQWRRFGLGPIDVNFLAASPQRVIRSSANVARTRSPDYELLFLRRGCVDVVHALQNIHVAEGSFVLLDNQKPWELSFKGDSDTVAAHLSDSWLRKWVPYPEELVARSIAGVATWGAPLAATLIAIADRGLDGVAVQRSVLADQCGALLTLMAGVPGAVTSRHNHEMLVRLKREIEARFHEPDLHPATLAQSMCISKRHLHALFARAGTTYGATLLEIRLTKAAAFLTDTRYCGYTIGDVAYECGFADPSHFARRFRTRFGAAPAEYRGRHASGLR